MKVKVLAVLSLALFLGLAGCRGGNTNTNANATNANSNMNTNMNMNMATATPAPAADAAAKSAVEDALKKKNITGVTVEATTAEVTLRGSVAKGKMGEAVQAAQEAGKRKVNNQLTEAK